MIANYDSDVVISCEIRLFSCQQIFADLFVPNTILGTEDAIVNKTSKAQMQTEWLSAQKPNFSDIIGFQLFMAGCCRTLMLKSTHKLYDQLYWLNSYRINLTPYFKCHLSYFAIQKEFPQNKISHDVSRINNSAIL